MATIKEKKKPDNSKCCGRWGDTWFLIHFCWECKMVQLSWKTVWQCLIKWRMCFLNDLTIPSLSMKHKVMKSFAHKPGHRRSASLIAKTAASCVMAKPWKQPKCPSEAEKLNKLRYIHTTKYCSAMKRSKLLIHTTARWLFSTINWVKKTANLKCYILYVINILNLTKLENKLMVTRG